MLNYAFILQINHSLEFCNNGFTFYIFRLTAKFENVQQSPSPRVEEVHGQENFPKIEWRQTGRYFFHLVNCRKRYL